MGGVLPQVIHPHHVERGVHPLPDLRRGNPQIFRAEGYIFLDHAGDNLVVRVLKDHPDLAADSQEIFRVCGIQALHPEFSRRWRQQGVHMFGQGGFPGAVVPQNGHKGAGLDF